MHVLMMSVYAAMAAVVLHGLKIFGSFLGIGLLLSWILFPIPW